MIINLHSHLIPGVDDGAQTIEQSLELAKLAVSEGVKQMILISHHRNGKYINLKQDVMKTAKELAGIYEEHKVGLTVYGSQEIRITESFFDGLYNDDLLPLDATGVII